MFEDRIAKALQTFKESANIRAPGSLSSPTPPRQGYVFLQALYTLPCGLAENSAGQHSRLD